MWIEVEDVVFYLNDLSVTPGEMVSFQSLENYKVYLNQTYVFS